MARVLVTGAGGFIGRRLAAALRSRPFVSVGERKEPISELWLTDRGAVEVPEGEPRTFCVAGDLSEPGFIETLSERGFDSVFHLASTLTLDAERDPIGAFANNVEPLRQWLEKCRHPHQRVVYASSIAVFGGHLPETVTDLVRPTPATTYGTHKAICELLLADYSRQGFVDGRSLRLPIVLVREGSPTAAVSDRIAALVREPLSGRDTECPLSMDTPIPVASVGNVVANLIAIHELSAKVLPQSRVMNLPALTVSVGEILHALKAHAALARVGHVRIVPDPVIEKIVADWPKRFVSQDATRLGLLTEGDFAEIIADYLSHRSGDHDA